MSKKWTEFGPKASMVDADLFAIVDSEDANNATKNKTVRKDVAQSGLQPEAPAGNNLGNSAGWTAAGDSATRNVGTGAGDVAAGNAPAGAVTSHESTYAHANLPTTAEKAAMTNANAPSGVNPFLTQADGGGGGGGHVIQDEGVDLPQRTNLNFIGATVTAADDAGNDATTVTISSGAGGGDVTGPDGGTSSEMVALYANNSGKEITTSALKYIPSASNPFANRDLLKVEEVTADAIAAIWLDTTDAPDLVHAGTLYFGEVSPGFPNYQIAMTQQSNGQTGASHICYGPGDVDRTAMTFAVASLTPNANDFIQFSVGAADPLIIRETTINAAVPIALPGDPTTDLQAATKQYVDNAGGGGWVDGSEILHWIDSVVSYAVGAGGQAHAVTFGHLVDVTLTASGTINFTGTISADDSRNFACRISTGGFTPTFQWNGTNLTTTMDWWDISANADYLVTFFADSAGCQITGLAQLGAAA